MAKDNTVLRRAFADICRGYSVVREGERDLYVRHLSHFEHVEYDLLEARFRDEAIAQGGPTEQQRLDVLTAKGEWSPTRDAEIVQQRTFIAQLEAGRKTIAVPSVLRSHDDHIARERDKLTKLLTTRLQLIGMTAELHAQRLLDDHYLVHNLFTDRALTTLAYDILDSEEQVDAIHALYRGVSDLCSDTNLRRLAVSDDFMSYWAVAADNPTTFFRGAPSEWTYYQVRLANHARYWKALMEGVDMERLTPEQRSDPDAIEQAHLTQRNTAAITAKGEVPVGLSASDLKETGLDKQMSAVPPPGVSGAELIKWLRNNQRR